MKLKKILPLVLAAAVILGACSPTQPQAAPTADPKVLEGTVAAAMTQAVGTALADQQNNPAVSTPAPVVEAPTYTPYPTYTPFPTNTVVVVPTSKPVVQQSTNTAAAPTATSLPKEYSCAVLSVSPASGAEMSPGNDFDAKFTLRNTGTKDWGAGDFDIAYTSGEKSMVKHEVYDLPATVKSDEKVDILMDFLAPSSAGRYTVQYKLNGGTTFCAMDVTINVK